jgi:hypothetical protein
MVAITTRSGKGAELTHAEVDTNFNNLNDALNLYGFYKKDSSSPAFVKTGAGTISVTAGTRVAVAGVTVVDWLADTDIVMPTLTAGTDYAIYACADGSIRADSSFSAPDGYTAANSRLIGGFHYGLTADGTTLASGSFATTGNGMIWVQSNVDDIAGINKFSIWDLKFRPKSDPRGMFLGPGNFWMDIYLCSTDVDTNGTSKSGTNIASGTVLPKIPVAFGGDGTATYPTLNWWVANELAASQNKRLPWEHEFVIAAFGVTENQSIDATASTYPITQRNPGYTSKRGGEQMSGHHWTWGLDTGTAASAFAWGDVNGNNGVGTGRGQMYNNTNTRVLLGGARASGSFSGSRAASWNYYPWYSGWNIGLRAASDHMQLD